MPIMKTFAILHNVIVGAHRNDCKCRLRELGRSPVGHRFLSDEKRVGISLHWAGMGSNASLIAARIALNDILGTDEAQRLAFKANSREHSRKNFNNMARGMFRLLNPIQVNYIRLFISYDQSLPFDHCQLHIH